MILSNIIFLCGIALSSGNSNSEFVNKDILQNSTSSTAENSLSEVDKSNTNETSSTTETVPPFFATKEPESLVGWLQNPKKEIPTTTHNPIDNNLVKDGFCGNKHQYGIRCGKRMDQCKRDSNCPGVTKCCLVSDCGFLCVRPKAKVKHEKKKSIKEISKKTGVTTAEGLKVEDITKIPQDKAKLQKEETRTETPQEVTKAITKNVTEEAIKSTI